MQEYDATCLVSKYNDVSATILIDQVQINLLFGNEISWIVPFGYMLLTVSLLHMKLSRDMQGGSRVWVTDSAELSSFGQNLYLW